MWWVLCLTEKICCYVVARGKVACRQDSSNIYDYLPKSTAELLYIGAYRSYSFSIDLRVHSYKVMYCRTEGVLMFSVAHSAPLSSYEKCKLSSRTLIFSKKGNNQRSLVNEHSGFFSQTKQDFFHVIFKNKHKSTWGICKLVSSKPKAHAQ